MTLRFDRSLPPAVALAFLGAVLALGALLLPWYELNPEAAKAFFREMASALTGQGVLTAPAGHELDQAVEAGSSQIVRDAGKDLVGLRIFAPLSVGLHALAVGAIWVALKVWAGEADVAKQRGELVGAAVLLAARPVLALVRNPADLGDDSMPGVPVPTDLLTPGPGIWVALAGSTLLLVAALMLRSSATTSAQPAWAAPGAGGPAAGYVPASAPPGVPAPSLYAPGGAYGEEGPGTLDRDSRLVRPNDQFAPRPLPAPAVPIMPVPAAVMPLHDPAPVTDAPGSIYGLPGATAPQAPTPTGSTAPPGFV